MTHATMCNGDDQGSGCFVPWCDCSCHKPTVQDHTDRSTT